MRRNARAYILPIVYVTIIIVAVVYVNWKDYTVGFWLNLYPDPKNPPPEELTAGEPFHVVHGWVQEGSNPFGYAEGYEFRLEVDGSYVDPSYIVKQIGNQISGNPYIRYIFNFTNGMPEGTHTFTPHWIAPCYDFFEQVPFGICRLDDPTKPEIDSGALDYEILFTP